MFKGMSMFVPLILSAFFATLVLYFLSFKYPHLFIFISLFINIVSFLYLVYKTGGIEFIKTLVR